MASIPPLELGAIPQPASRAWDRLRDELLTILGDDLIAIWAHGGTLASRQPRAADRTPT
jgi:hypothetical protein